MDGFSLLPTKRGWNFIFIYEDDELLCVEIIQFSKIIKLYFEPVGISNKYFMYKTLIEKDVLTVFPNVKIALYRYLVIMNIKCCSER